MTPERLKQILRETGDETTGLRFCGVPLDEFSQRELRGFAAVLIGLAHAVADHDKLAEARGDMTYLKEFFEYITRDQTEVMH